MLAAGQVRRGWAAVRGSPADLSQAALTSSRSGSRDLAYTPLELESVPKIAMGKGGGDLGKG